MRSPRAPRRPRRWTLRTRLVVSAVALIAVVAAVIGTVTVIGMRSNLQRQLDDSLRPAVGHAAQRGPSPSSSLLADGGLPPVFVAGPGQPLGTVGARTGPDGQLVSGARSIRGEPGEPRSNVTSLTAEQVRALGSVPKDGQVHTFSVPGLGSYRAAWSRDGSAVLGFPLKDVESTVDNLVLVIVWVTAAGLVAAGIAGAAIVGVALRPLRRVAATATRVSELPLHSGEVALHERVPDAEADPRTEVGQVGAALNRMLGHVGSALAARQESETRVRQFVADASHELRTPLASIRGYAELTRRGTEEVGPATRHALGRVEAEAQRMTGLVEDLLLLARLDAGRPLSYESTDLSPLVVDAVSDARAAGQGHQWRLELPEVPDDPVSVLGDGARLHQVLVNLLGNARTHTPDGTTVTARVARRGAWAVLEVEDDGPGIPPALLPHVFERFARGDASRSRAHGSTGLGLAIVQAVVAAHGGGVSVRSAPGSTVFSVHLPVPSTSATRPAKTPAPVPVPHSQPAHSRTTQV
ncbi:HAMP domain-containing sensor histidine kinase [Streptomyces sp. BPTC-684]|uniref:HAMP domain-containing sensor histidine kinase n=1 Tax=Streptomyces sp. BPTC-684 TaxID=3043734 RepID=UPI0024B1AE84|nr:HAMP domain-containing sensor histidine kinase [Streptomyces sp. BPTC-684]WHM41302.1 HAMP domain-containing sensor histidine kinase [Streptomyces sp. BPTC-684]